MHVYLCIFNNFILGSNLMPVMDGPTASKRLRELGYQGMIFGLTGHALPADIEYYMKSGADRVMVKPLRKEALFSLIDEFSKGPALCSVKESGQQQNVDGGASMSY